MIRLIDVHRGSCRPRGPGGPRCKKAAVSQFARRRECIYGTGYAVWTGIGAAGTALLGMAILGDAVAPMRILCIALILAGVIGLKLVS